MSNFWKRAITGVFFVSAVVVAIFYSDAALTTLFGVAAIIGVTEYTNITGRPFYKDPSGFVATITGGLFYLSLVGIWHFQWDVKNLLLCVLGLILLAVIELFRKTSDFTKFTSIALGTIWIPAVFGLILHVGTIEGYYEPLIPMAFFIFLWLNDTGAYLVGRSIGKTKLIPKISPNKTVEGFVGGIGLTLAASFIWSHFVTDVLSRTDWIVFAVSVAVFSNFGDFTESMLKRQFGVKDSGKILPGHGGVLDRFDGLLLTIPLLFVYLIFRYS